MLWWVTFEALMGKAEFFDWMQDEMLSSSWSLPLELWIPFVVMKLEKRTQSLFSIIRKSGKPAKKNSTTYFKRSPLIKVLIFMAIVQRWLSHYFYAFSNEGKHSRVGGSSEACQQVWESENLMENPLLCNSLHDHGFSGKSQVLLASEWASDIIPR